MQYTSLLQSVKSAVVNRLVVLINGVYRLMNLLCRMSRKALACCFFRRYPRASALRLRIGAFALLLTLTSNALAQEKSAEQFVSEIDEKMPGLLKDFSVPGAAIGIIDDGEIVLQKGYGFADVENDVEVTTKTGFNIGSISKTIAAWGVMKLVEEGKLDLDAPAEKYLSRWQFPESEFDSSEVTIRRMLSHTAGLSLHGYPGWSPEDELPTIEESLNGKNNGPGRVEIIMEPGTRYQYSGGGYTVMQLIIEEVTGQKFEDYMQAEVLDPLGMTDSSYKIDDKILAASAAEYDKFGDKTDFELFTAQAAAGLHTTIEDFTRFARANLYKHKDFEKHNSVLLGETLEPMMKAVPQARGRYGYGMAYFVSRIPGTTFILNGHRGANTGWHAIFDVNTETNDGFIMITNGGSGHQVYNHIYADWALWQMDAELEYWHKSNPPISHKLKSIIDSGGIEDVARTYKELKAIQSEHYDFSESHLNDFGYYYMAKDDVEKALVIFKLNVEAFPDSGNVYDSYGEALLKQGNREEAIKNYRKSLELVPQNENAIQILKDLGVSIDHSEETPDVDPYFSESTGVSSDSGPMVITRNVLQDSNGNFWLATWNGIVRYDGSSFTNVTNKEGLRRYRAFTLLEDHKENIWVGTVGAGVYRYDGKTWTNITTKDGLVDNSTVSLMQDSDNNIWIGAMGVTKFDGTTFTSFDEDDGFTSLDVNSISEAPDGSIWFGTRGALFQYDGEAFVNFTEKHGLYIGSLIPTLVDRQGHLWFGGQNGLYHFDGENVQHVFKQACFSLFEDSDGNIWFSGGGLIGHGRPEQGTTILNRFDPANGLENILTKREQIVIQQAMLFGLTGDKDGNIWFGSTGGVGRIDGYIVKYY